MGAAGALTLTAPACALRALPGPGPAAGMQANRQNTGPQLPATGHFLFDPLRILTRLSPQ